MANKLLFNSLRNLLHNATETNNAGGRSYKMSAKHALAQYAATGCMNGTYYADATEQLDHVSRLAAEVDAQFIAKVAIHVREAGRMKDMPALICAILSTRDAKLLERIFPRVIDNGRMLRNFVQIMRSGVVGRRSLGTLPKRLVRQWFANRTDDQVFKQSVGDSPSFADIIRMVHPHPATESRAAMYAWMIGRKHDAEKLPLLVREFEAFKNGDRGKVPSVPFQMLTALPLGRKEWVEIAWNMGWHALRMNINTLVRHEVFNEGGMKMFVATRLADETEIRRAKAQPYQIFAAYKNIDPNVPQQIAQALSKAADIAVSNVPVIEGKVYVLLDVSGSMHSPVTGHRAGATTKVQCVDVAALMAAAIARNNPNAEVIPFSNVVTNMRINSNDSLLANASLLRSAPSGGTDCSAPLMHLNKIGAKGDAIIYVSDNESWMDVSHSRGTAVMDEWEKFRKRNPHSRLVCIDLQPNTSLTAPNRPDILNVGGFSDAVFEVLADFVKGGGNADHWVRRIESVEL
jgi:60 kDa SS-A/Ro ribonucleoprotein